MSGRANADVSAARWRDIWRRHESGTANRAIARELGITESTVRYYLAKPRPASLTRNNPAQPNPRSDAPLLRVSPAPNVIPIRRSS